MCRTIIIVKSICICDMILFIKRSVTITMNGEAEFQNCIIFEYLAYCMLNKLAGIIFLINIYIAIQNHQYRSDRSDQML